ncbi:MAG: PRC-barrel domain-containing protein, partial [Clostridia bacterium]|nr:PRC-barrel domain-containing protein [Clostridia bacterium]
MEKHSINKLRGKEVINICDGKRLGFIHDALIDVCSGSVSAVSVLFDCRTFGIG